MLYISTQQRGSVIWLPTVSVSVDEAAIVAAGEVVMEADAANMDAEQILVAGRAAHFQQSFKKWEKALTSVHISAELTTQSSKLKSSIAKNSKSLNVHDCQG